jgi:hypothetical protein
VSSAGAPTVRIFQGGSLEPLLEAIESLRAAAAEDVGTFFVFQVRDLSGAEPEEHLMEVSFDSREDFARAIADRSPGKYRLATVEAIAPPGEERPLLYSQTLTIEPAQKGKSTVPAEMTYGANHKATIVGGNCAIALTEVLDAMAAEARSLVGPHFVFEVRVDGDGTWQQYDPAAFDDLAEIAVAICSGKSTPKGALYQLKAFDSVTPAGLPRVQLSSGEVHGGPRLAPWYRRHAVPLILGSLTLAAGAAAAVALRRR